MNDKSNVADQLCQFGWSIKFELFSHVKQSTEQIKKQLLDCDLRTYGEKALPDLAKLDQTGKCFVVQLHKTRNVTASKDNENSSHRAHLYRLIITDGQVFQNALILPSLKNFSIDTPPGVKLLIKAKTKIFNGFYLLNDQSCEVLGGNVDELVQKWKLAKLMGKHVRTLMGAGAPPPWLPFGTRLNSATTVDTSQRSMDVAKVQQTNEEDPEFVRLRRAAIDTLVAGQVSKVERFARQDVSRGANLAVGHEQVQRRTTMEKSTPAASKPNNNSTTNTRLPDWAKNQIADEPSDERKPRAPFGRNRRNRDDDDGGEETRPSKDVTLFDFFGSKTKTSKNSTRPSASAQVSQSVRKQLFEFENGDQVLVRYAEDNEYYPAVILNVMHEKQKCLVMFEGFDNEELVSFDDVEPFEEGYYEGQEQNSFGDAANQRYSSAGQYHQQHYDYSNRNRPNSSQQGMYTNRYYQ